MEQFAKKTITKIIHPKILYYGTPVILLTTLNEDETVNISPISSSWALGDYIMVGLGVGGKAFENLNRHPECVINIPDPSLWKNVERLAPFTGKNPVPESKREIGFTYNNKKYEVSKLTAVSSKSVKPTRIQECPIQIEAKVHEVRVPDYCSEISIVETEAINVHAHMGILSDEEYIDPEKWSPLIYNFRHYFGLGHQLGKTFRA
ncbi:flavin reductase family protein [Alkalihalobacillus sp. TS-13]|uniref:flavin reductase family protein n=1 Tax=Alkalihalobacillus sp. TS-13 TaxID=2842455 RepID=UPI001C884853|nr:flavin reductase family protein [Alkalihalobacillus sp. TS-13]